MSSLHLDSNTNISNNNKIDAVLLIDGLSRERDVLLQGVNRLSLTLACMVDAQQKQQQN